MAFRTARGEFGLISRMDWLRIARHAIHVNNTGYMRVGMTMIHDLLLRPPPGYDTHHRNSLRVDNRRRNLQVLRQDVHHAFHGRQKNGLRTGLDHPGAGWRARLRVASRDQPGCGTFRNWEIAAGVRDDCLRHQARSSLSVFDGTILDRDVPELLAAQAGQAMGFTFVARGDGEVRHLSGIERANVADTALARRLVDRGILLIWSGNRNQWRRVPLAGLLWVTASGHTVRVLHQREGSTCRI